MRILILSRGEGIHTTKRLVEAALVLGHNAVVVDPLALQLSLARGKPTVLSGGKVIARPDVCIPRIAQSIASYGLAVVGQLAASGVPVLNSAEGIGTARNKMRLMQLLTEAGLAVPPTAMGTSTSHLRGLAKQVGGLPVVVRLEQAGGREGIIVCETAQSLEAVLEAVQSLGHDAVVQRYVRPGSGRDLRALVVGGDVIAAVRRQPTAGRVHLTLTHGATLTRTKLTDLQRNMAIAATRTAGLEVAAVDMLEHKRGETQVFEVHSCPGLRELEVATGDDLARPMVERAVGMAVTPRKRRIS